MQLDMKYASLHRTEPGSHEMGQQQYHETDINVKAAKLITYELGQQQYHETGINVKAVELGTSVTAAVL